MTNLHSACGDDFFEKKTFFFSEQIVTFRSVFGPRVKRLWTFGESVSPVSWKLHFTCPKELVERNVTIGKKNFDFFYFKFEIFFSFLAYLFIGFAELCSTCLHQHFRKKIEIFDLREFFWRWWELFWSGLTNLQSACPGNRFEITFLKSFQVALCFANRSGKLEAFKQCFFSEKWLSELLFPCSLDCFEKTVHYKKSSCL